MAKTYARTSNNISVLISKHNAQENRIGDLALLTTSQDSSLVGAINELVASLDALPDSSQTITLIDARIDSDDFVDLVSNQSVDGLKTFTYGTTRFTSDSALASNILGIGEGRADSGNASIDLVGDTVYTDFGLRILRNAGENGSSLLSHRGDGAFVIRAQDSGEVQLQSGGTSVRQRINPNGYIEFEHTSAIKLPRGTTGQRSDGAAGDVRTNSTTLRFEGYENSAWRPFVREEETLTGGFAVEIDSDGTQSSGTYTPTPVGGNFKAIVNGGAFTLAAPTYAGSYTMIIEVTNNDSAGAITFSGFDRVLGSTIDTTSGNVFHLNITKINSSVLLNKIALQ